MKECVLFVGSENEHDDSAKMDGGRDDLFGSVPRELPCGATK
jgi:hypothetical protein